MLPHWEVHDRGAGPWMLMVHGFLSSRAQWRINLPALTQVARPVLLELFGHGRSATPTAVEPYKVESYISAFETIRKAIGAERWVVCGQSFGAGLAVQYALEHPDRVRGLIFTNSISAFSPKGDPDREAVQRERARVIEADGKAALQELRIHPRHAKRFPETIKAELVADADMLDPAGILRSIALTSPDLSIAHRLGEIRVPSMLVNGTWEKSFQPMRAHIAEAIPGVEIVDLDGGHSINIEAAEGFDAAVTRFVASLPA
jgi:2-succinyl-6-hydroxy-2,4-cyclohexadiene-1-carboxylate synthase